MKCECKLCPLHMIIRLCNKVVERCKAVIKAIIGK